MLSWREFVKEVQLKHKISYKDAMRRASPLWRAKPDYEKKTKRNKGPTGLKKVPEVSQFPAKMRFKTPQVKKREIPDILLRAPRKRLRPRSSDGPIDDLRFRYLNVNPKHIDV